MHSSLISSNVPRRLLERLLRSATPCLLYARRLRRLPDVVQSLQAARGEVHRGFPSDDLSRAMVE